MLQTCYYKIIIAILLVPVLAISQNLVPNGNFETYSICPTGLGQIVRASGWYAASLTPDYYNACNGFGNNVYVPRNEMGYQVDCCGGSGYSGLSPFYTSATNNDGREYIYTKLIDTLKAGHKYLASIYVSRAEGWDYAIATIGMLFTDTAIILPYPQSSILTTPQVNHTTLIADTSHWTLIQDTVVAVGNEAYLTIGNFNTTATSDSVHVGGNGMYFGEAYYYIDGVSVYDLATMGIEQLAVSNEQLNIYPNPASTVLKITLNNESIVTAKIYDLLGNEVLQIQQKEIDVSGLNNGVYFLTVKTNNGILSKKIIVQH